MGVQNIIQQYNIIEQIWYGKKYWHFSIFICRYFNLTQSVFFNLIYIYICISWFNCFFLIKIIYLLFDNKLKLRVYNTVGIGRFYENKWKCNCSLIKIKYIFLKYNLFHATLFYITLLSILHCLLHYVVSRSTLLRFLIYTLPLFDPLSSGVLSSLSSHTLSLFLSHSLTYFHFNGKHMT